jgi:hypothetical protein
MHLTIIEDIAERAELSEVCFCLPWFIHIVYSLYSFFIVVIDFFMLRLTVHFIKKLKIIIYFVVIYFITK